MAPLIIKIGSSPKNELCINDPRISNMHAELEKNSDGTMWIIDKESTNGTYVNALRISRRQIGFSDTVVLGGSYSLDIRKVLHAGNDYTEEFNQLKTTYLNYKDERKRIRRKEILSNVFKSFPVYTISLVGIILSFIFGRGSTLFSILTGAAFFTIILFGVFYNIAVSTKLSEKKEMLEENYQRDFVCPKCGLFLGAGPYENFIRLRQCANPHCRAKYVIE